MTRTIDTDPSQMYDNMEFVLNSGEYGSGITDALAHLGQLISGDLDPITVQDVHDELLESEPNSNYVLGYIKTWNNIDALVTDAVYELTPNVD